MKRSDVLEIQGLLWAIAGLLAFAHLGVLFAIGALVIFFVKLGLSMILACDEL